MESDSNSAVPHSALEMEDGTDNSNGYSKVPEPSNGNEWKDLKDEYNPSCPNVLKNSSTSSSPKLETHSNGKADLILSAPDAPSSENLEKLSAVAKVLKETSNGVGKMSTENGRSLNLPPSNEDGSIQSTLTEESTAKSQSSYDTTKAEEKLLCEKIASALGIQSPIYEKMQSTKGNQPAFSQNIKGKEKPVYEGIASTTVSQPSFSKKTISAETTKLAHSEKAKTTTELKTSVSLGKPYVSMETMSGALELKYDDRPVISSDSENVYTDANYRDFYVKTTDLDKITARNGMKSPSVESLSPTPLPPALDTKEFFSLLDTEEYKNAYVITMPGCNVIVSPSEYEQSLDFNKPLTSTDELKLDEDTCFQLSLDTLLSMFSDWININVRRCKKVEQNPNVEDFVECTKKELKYGLDLLRLMYKRVDTLMRAVHGLPDPTSILPPEFQSERISIRKTLKDAGAKVQRKLQLLEAEGFEFYDSFVSHFETDENSSTKDETPKRLMVVLANGKFHNLVDKTADDCLLLRMEIKNFRDNIRDFCLEMDRLM